MKKSIVYLLLGSFLFAPAMSEAQILKRVKRKVENKVVKEVEDALNEEEAEPEKDKKQVGENEEVQKTKSESAQDPVLVWAKYDFVPGENIIFEDNQENEENGEFPSRWDLDQGNVENAVFGGENVIMFRGGFPTIIPYLKNPESDYLPEVFTVEFDIYMPDRNIFTVYFYDRKNQRSPSGRTSSLFIRSESLELRPAKSSLPNKESIQNKWAHIAIAYTNGKMKAYIDETRLINIPHLDYNPTGISLNAYFANDDRRYYVKNFRIAEGGVKYYDRLLQDGKIVANGIRFDVNKTTIKPESMGVINEIYELMIQHEEIKFSIEGHTDSDGEADFNQNLSEGRADAVKNLLVTMGIDAKRLTSKGHGESKPIGSNDTAEGKAANRRVEFIKKPVEG